MARNFVVIKLLEDGRQGLLQGLAVALLGKARGSPLEAVTSCCADPEVESPKLILLLFQGGCGELSCWKLTLALQGCCCKALCVGASCCSTTKALCWQSCCSVSWKLQSTAVSWRFFWASCLSGSLPSCWPSFFSKMLSASSLWSFLWTSCWNSIWCSSWLFLSTLLSVRSWAESFCFEKLRVSVRLAAESKLLSERHAEDKDSFGSCLMVVEAGSCRQSCCRCTAVSCCCSWSCWWPSCWEAVLCFSFFLMFSSWVSSSSVFVLSFWLLESWMSQAAFSARFIPTSFSQSSVAKALLFALLCGNCWLQTDLNESSALCSCNSSFSLW